MVGVGYGKAKEVPAAIAKGVEEAKKNFFRVPRIGGTIVHRVQGEAAAGVVMLRPASPGTGVIAGGPVRAVLECAGVHDVLSKSLGSDNAINIVHATVAALKQISASGGGRGPPWPAARGRRPGQDAARPCCGRAGFEVIPWRQLKITQVRSTIGSKQNQRATLLSLGLRKIRQSVEREDTPQIRGMIRTVRHLVTVEEVVLMTIKIHDLRPAPGAKTAKTRVGRGEGGKGGKTAGRGTKGTGARKNVPAGFEGGQMPLHMRLPKLKGFRNRFRVEYQVVNVGDLGTLFPDGGTVGPEELAEAGAVRRNKPVKVLGNGDLGVALTSQRARVLGQRPREDHGGGRLGHRAVVAPDHRVRGAEHCLRRVRSGGGSARRRCDRSGRLLESLPSVGPSARRCRAGLFLAGRRRPRLRPESVQEDVRAQRFPVGPDHAGPPEEDSLHPRDSRGLPRRGGASRRPGCRIRTSRSASGRSRAARTPASTR